MKQREEDLAKNRIVVEKNQKRLAFPVIYMKDHDLIHSFTKNLTMKWVQKFIGGTGSKNVLILSHNDADGHGSSAVIYMIHKNENNKPTVYNIDGYTFDYSTIKDKIHDADIVYITDLSLAQKQMEYIISNAKEDGLICWIDHHPTSLSVDIKDDRLFRFIHSEIGISAMASCYAYSVFMDKIINDIYKDDNIPTVNDIDRTLCRLIGEKFDIQPIVQYISLYDTFHDDMDLRFTYGFNTVEHNINSDLGLIFWKATLLNPLFDGDKYVNHIIDNGEIIKNYVDTDCARIRKDQLIEVTFHIIDNTGTLKKEYDCNAAILNINAFSMSFGSEIETHDICIRYYQKTDGTWSYGCYSSKVRDTTMNCMQFAKHFGGGGHVHAAGFSTKQNIVNQWIHSSEKDGKITLYLEK